MGVHIYVFAVGSYITGIGEMAQVAGSSSSTEPDGYLFRVSDYGELAKFSELVVRRVASTGKYISISPDPSPKLVSAPFGSLDRNVSVKSG